MPPESVDAGAAAAPLELDAEAAADPAEPDPSPAMTALPAASVPSALPPASPGEPAAGSDAALTRASASVPAPGAAEEAPVCMEEPATVPSESAESA
jgi:hypothetical protein